MENTYSNQVKMLNEMKMIYNDLCNCTVTWFNSNVGEYAQNLTDLFESFVNTVDPDELKDLFKEYEAFTPSLSIVLMKGFISRPNKIKVVLKEHNYDIEENKLEELLGSEPLYRKLLVSLSVNQVLINYDANNCSEEEHTNYLEEVYNNPEIEQELEPEQEPARSPFFTIEELNNDLHTMYSYTEDVAEKKRIKSFIGEVWTLQTGLQMTDEVTSQIRITATALMSIQFEDPEVKECQGIIFKKIIEKILEKQKEAEVY